MLEIHEPKLLPALIETFNTSMQSSRIYKWLDLVLKKYKTAELLTHLESMEKAATTSPNKKAMEKFISWLKAESGKANN